MEEYERRRDPHAAYLNQWATSMVYGDHRMLPSKQLYDQCQDYLAD